MPTKSGGEVPSHIRQDLPLELSELPDELIYAADLSVFEFSGSEAVHLAAESHEALVHHLSDLYGGAWPPEADDAARETWQEFERTHQRMEDAKEWIRENRRSTSEAPASSQGQAGEEVFLSPTSPAWPCSDSSDSSSDVESYLLSVDDDGRMEVDESGEEAGGDDTQDDPVL